MHYGIMFYMKVICGAAFGDTLKCSLHSSSLDFGTKLLTERVMRLSKKDNER